MKIAIASDHGGFALKQNVIRYLNEIIPDATVTDFGCFNEESCDYPDFAIPAAEAVANGACDKGVVICTTGIGVSVCANKVRGVRCALCTSVFQAEMTRRHNDTNVLALGAKCVDESTAKEIVSTWFNTAFEGGRHQRRVDKITQYEK